MKALIAANGSIENIAFYKNEVLNTKYDLIIGADGGIENLLKLGIRPDVAIGDFDSISNITKTYIINNNIKKIEFLKEKDESDTELAIDYCINNKFTDIILIGCIGSRIDHTLANIYLLNKLLEHKINFWLINENNKITLIDKEITLNNMKNHTISLLPMTDEVCGICSEGLYYPLNNNKMTKNKPYGISNVIVEQIVNIKVKKGKLLIMISKD